MARQDATVPYPRLSGERTQPEFPIVTLHAKRIPLREPLGPIFRHTATVVHAHEKALRDALEADIMRRLLAAHRRHLRRPLWPPTLPPTTPAT